MHTLTAITTETSAFMFGALLVLIALIGGGLKLRELTIPPIGHRWRILVGLFGFAFILYSLIHSYLFSSQTLPQYEADLESVHSPAIKSVLGRAAVAEQSALKNFDTSTLHKIFKGEALELALERIKAHQDSNITTKSAFHDQDIQTIYVTGNPLRAEVHMVETWSSISYNSTTGECVSRIPKSAIQQVVYLEHTASGWMIDTINPDFSSMPNPQPCS
jgi:hypothetical protein